MTAPRTSRRQAQRGAIAVIAALSMTVLLGFLGLAIDGGRLYLSKTELQNAADACALAAVQELATSLTAADAVGQTVAQRHRTDFQSTALLSSAVALTYAASLSGPWSAASAGGTPSHVRCTVTRTGFVTSLMQAIGVGTQTISASATATLAPAQTTCALPIGLCSTSSTGPDYGFVKGKWYSMNLNSGGGDTVAKTLDYDPSSVTSGCTNNSQELSCLLAGAGQCSLPNLQSGISSCSTSGNAKPSSNCVGVQTSAANWDKAYNSRFGLYQNGGGGYNSTSAPPDYTGKVYTPGNWAAGKNAYSDFVTARNSNTVTQSGSIPGGYTAQSSSQLAASGQSRRIAVVPIINCAGNNNQHKLIRTYACVLLLNPSTGSGNTQVEYLGVSGAAGTPCIASGAVGASGTAGTYGAPVPALTQ